MSTSTPDADRFRPSSAPERWQPRTFASCWEAAVRADPNATFLVYEHDDSTSRVWTYGEFDGVVDRTLLALQGLGVNAGDVIHVALGNCPTFVALWLATTRLGATIVPSDPRSTPRELSVHVDRARPTLGVCGAQNLDAYRAATPTQMRILASDEGPDVDAVLQASPAHRPVASRPQPTDTAAILFTSGTTSAPKGVKITQANYAFAGEVMSAAASLSSSDRYLVVLPLFHANAQYYCFAAAIYAGASVALMPRFSATRLLSQAARYKVTHVSLFASPIRMLLARGDTPVDGLQIRNAWYAQRLTPAEYDRASDLLGCPMREIYGMTETIAAVLSSRPTARFTEAVGPPTLGCAVTLLRPHDEQSVEVESVGEIAVGGRPGRELFAGYLDDPGATARAWDGEWFRTGDLGRLDDAGEIIFHGRRGDVLKVAGENVSVLEVEAVMAEHPDVSEVAVVGEPDLVRDEVPVAHVVLRQSAQTTVEDLLAHGSRHLAPAKRPHRVYVVDALPRTSVGKIRRFLLKPPP